MRPAAYYNEIDPKKAAWLRVLIEMNLIAPGDIDGRDIQDVLPNELAGYTQCHFFAGVGIWSYALRQGGWPDDRPVWTGSCPCQPFSAAGKRAGITDERHLWPAWFWLIQQSRPDVIFGEQVASKDGLAWLDVVQSDLEATAHTFAALDLCAAGFGAPHIRQRLFFVANSPSQRYDGRRSGEKSGRKIESQRLRDAHGLGDPASARSFSSAHGRIHSREEGNGSRNGEPERPGGATGGFWANAEWIYCRDGKYRPTEPGLFPLAHGAPERMVRLRGYGDGIVAPVAEEFIRAYLENDCP